MRGELLKRRLFGPDNPFGSPDPGRPFARGSNALELAKRRRARSVTVLSPGGFYNTPEASYARLLSLLSVRTGRLLVPRADRLFASPLARMLAFGQLVAHPTRISPADAAASLRALVPSPSFDETLSAAARDRFGDGAQISVPVTIAWGEKDRLLLPRQARRAARLIPGARIVILRGCGHITMTTIPLRSHRCCSTEAATDVSGA